jgi:hypothetical protein
MLEMFLSLTMMFPPTTPKDGDRLPNRIECLFYLKLSLRQGTGPMTMMWVGAWSYHSDLRSPRLPCGGKRPSGT